MECLRKQLLDVLADGLSAAAAQEKELGPSEDEDVGQMMDPVLKSTQVKLISVVFELISVF